MTDEKQLLDELSERISHLPEHEQRDVISTLTSQLPRGSFFVAQKQAKAKFRENYAQEHELPEKEYIKYHLHKAAYDYILAHGGTQDEAWQYTAELFEDSVERLHKAKKETHAKWHMRKVVQDNKDHTTQRDMVKRGIISQLDLSNKTTPNSQLERLVKAVNLYKWIKQVEDRVKEHENKIKLLEAHKEQSEREISELQKLVGAQGLSRKERVQIYKKNGLTKKEIAEILHVSTKTVQREWN